MRDFSEQSTEIKQFLLGLLETERAEQIEARIFTEADFAEEVQIVESELITNYRKGDLTAEESSIFERRYLTSPASRRIVEYENAFSELLQAERVKKTSLPETLTAQATQPETEKGTSRSPQKEPERQGWTAWLQALFKTRPRFAYSMSFVILLLLIGTLFWYLPREDAAQAERRAREIELAQLNIESYSALQGREVAAVDLTPTERNAGIMSRITISDARQDGLIKFRLNLRQYDTKRYRAVFLDERRQELFAISNLTAQKMLDDSQIRLFVPARYLKRGDYQIDLNRLMDDGTYQNASTYLFRNTESR